MTFSTRIVAVAPVRKSISRTDVQAMGLILMILLVIDLPVYRSATKISAAPATSVVAGAKSAPAKGAHTAIALANRSKSDVPSPTKLSGASTAVLAH